jgi:glycosyltransferase involved in cell wall biosynthesis
MLSQRACFFAKVRDLQTLERVEFYAQDIRMLRVLGYDVQIATHPSQLRPADLYFVWWWTWAFFPVAFARLLRRPVIVTGVFDLWAMDPRPFAHRRLIEFALKHADANVFISEMERREVPERFEVRRPYYSPLSVNTDVYHPDGACRQNVVLSIGALQGMNAVRKGMPEVIRAACAVHRDHPEVRFVIAGEKGAYYPALQKLVKDLGADSYVEFPGIITAEKKIELMQSSKVYLQPSRFEGFGLANMEAMSCGMPVVTRPVGAVPEVVGNAGLQLDETEPETIAEAVNRVLEDDALREEMGTRARRRLESCFPYSRRKLELEKIISEVCRKEH